MSLFWNQVFNFIEYFLQVDFSLNCFNLPKRPRQVSEVTSAGKPCHPSFDDAFAEQE